MTSSNPIPALSHSDQNKGSGQQSSTGGIQAMMPSIFGPAKQTPPEMKGQTCLVTGGAFLYLCPFFNLAFPARADARPRPRFLPPFVASRGIGFETALAFAKAHARVVLTSSTESGGREAVAAIKARAGESAEVEWFGADLCDLKQTKEALDAFVAREDRPDLVVLDAGFMRAHDTTADGIEHAFVVNFLSEVLAVNRLLPLLRRTAGRADGGARIVVVTSEHHRFCPSAMHFGSLDEINDPSLTPSQLYGRTKVRASLTGRVPIRRRSSLLRYVRIIATLRPPRSSRGC